MITRRELFTGAAALAGAAAIPTVARAQNPPATDDFPAEADKTWRADWRYLATPLSQPVAAIGADAKGLALPKSVIDKIYWANARRFFKLPR